jgi:hypothetical protein
MKRTIKLFTLTLVTVGGISTSQTASANTVLDPYLPPGVHLDSAPYATYQQLADAAGAAAVAGVLPPDNIVQTAFNLGPSTTGGPDYRNADGLVLKAVLAQVGGNITQVRATVAAAFLSSNIGSITSTAADDSSVASALSAGIFTGLQQATVRQRLIGRIRNAAVVEAIKGAMVATTFSDGPQIAVPQSGPVDALYGNPTDGLAASKPAAGVITGIVSQYQLGTTKSNGVVGAIIRIAVQTDKSDYLQIAQAAAQTAAYVFSLSNVGGANAFGAGFIMQAVKHAFNPLGIVSAKKAGYIRDAVNFGKSLAIAYQLTSSDVTLGAGAAGVADYTYSGGSGTPVTDITGL